MHIQIGRERIAGIKQFPPDGYCAKEEFHANFYSFINSCTIRMHFNSQSEQI